MEIRDMRRYQVRDHRTPTGFHGSNPRTEWSLSEQVTETPLGEQTDPWAEWPLFFSWNVQPS